MFYTDIHVRKTRKKKRATEDFAMHVVEQVMSEVFSTQKEISGAGSTKSCLLESLPALALSIEQAKPC